MENLIDLNAFETIVGLLEDQLKLTGIEASKEKEAETMHRRTLVLLAQARDISQRVKIFNENFDKVSEITQEYYDLKTILQVEGE